MANPDKPTRSEMACPVCGQHQLALDEMPQIDVLGVQPYSELIGMGDVRSFGPIGIECLACGTHWRDRGAFDRNEPDPPDSGEELELAQEDGEEQGEGDREE